MNSSDQNRKFELLKEKYNRHEKILIQAYKSLKQKEETLKRLNEELCLSEEELQASNEELNAINEELFEKSEFINSQNTELKATLQHLKETQSQLLQAEKMASLGVLTAGVAHEINNPLNYILGGYVGLENYFEENNLLDKKVEILLKGIKTGVDRAADIVKGLNQFSRSNDVNNEDCDIHSILNNCLLMLNNQIKDRIEVKKRLTTESIYIIGNVGKLHQVFINTLSNSIQAIDNEGTISISTQRRDKSIVIKISDTGCGISKENLSKITDPFFTTKDPGKGTGLGLSITFQIIQEYKGNLEFQSEQNKGTTVIISFPIKK